MLTAVINLSVTQRAEKMEYTGCGKKSMISVLLQFWLLLQLLDVCPYFAKLMPLTGLVAESFLLRD